MITKYLKILISAFMLLHFVGVMQLVSSYAKDKTSFANALNMNEEETKKEKDSKEDTVESKDFKPKPPLQVANFLYCEKSFGFILASEEVKHQYIADLHSPPPDFIG